MTKYSERDLIWLTGVYEGEGHCWASAYLVVNMVITQKDSWLCEKIQSIFGGRIYIDKTRTKIHRWVLSGDKAYELYMLILKDLSPRRQAQIIPKLKDYHDKMLARATHWRAP